MIYDIRGGVRCVWCGICGICDIVCDVWCELYDGCGVLCTVWDMWCVCVCGMARVL